MLTRRSPFVLERRASRAAQAEFSRVRLVRAQAINAYVGRAQFASSHVVYHVEKRGFAALDAERARALEQILSGRVRARFGEAHRRAVTALEKIGWMGPSSLDLERVVARALGDFGALQNRRELTEFAQVVAARRPKVVVEIGTARGGLLFLLSQLAHPRATLVSIDHPGGPFGGGQSDAECELYASFGPMTQRFVFLRDRSFHLSTREDLVRALGGRPIDLLFIDGDHSYAGVRWDFEAYGSLVRDGGLVALHDVCLGPKNATRGFDVAGYFRALKRSYETRAIVDRSAPARMPIPDGSRAISLSHRMGIGLIELGPKNRRPAFRA